MSAVVRHKTAVCPPQKMRSRLLYRPDHAAAIFIVASVFVPAMYKNICTSMARRITLVLVNESSPGTNRSSFRSSSVPFRLPVGSPPRLAGHQAVLHALFWGPRVCHRHRAGEVAGLPIPVRVAQWAIAIGRCDDRMKDHTKVAIKIHFSLAEQADCIPVEIELFKEYVGAAYFKVDITFVKCG